jgi:hypothetical protein
MVSLPGLRNLNKYLTDFTKITCSMKIMKIYKHQKTNLKWFDRLTTLSQVEGQMPMTEIQNRHNGRGTYFK